MALVKLQRVGRLAPSPLCSSLFPDGDGRSRDSPHRIQSRIEADSLTGHVTGSAPEWPTGAADEYPRV